jgi:ABC-type oligopeptide transport system substrate-binding subunit
LGVKIAWGIMDWATFLDRVERGSQPMSLYGWVADYPDPDDFLRVSPIQRQTRWRHESYERLVEEARRVTDQRERMELYGQAEWILVQEAPIMPLVYGRRHLLVKPWVRKYPISPIGWWFWKDVILEPH